MRRVWRIVAALMTCASMAVADDAANQKFAAGTRASERHDWSAAEALFAESIRLTPSVGAYYNRGYCLEQLGRLREAYRDYREAERLAALRDDVRGKVAHDAAGRVLESLHYVELDIPPDVATRPDVRIVVDGAEISDAERRETLLSDSAVHTVSVSAPGRTTWARNDIADRTRVTLMLGAPIVVNANPAAPAEHTNRVVGVGAVGLGVVTLGVSAAVFFRGASHIDAVNHDCAMKDCDADTRSARDYRSNIAVATTVLDITGAMLIVGGAALWLWPKARPATFRGVAWSLP